MSLSEKIGKLTGHAVKGITAAPKASGSKFKQIGHDLTTGFREVVPAKEESEAANA